MSKKYVDYSYEELKSKLDEANKTSNHQKVLKCSIALVTKLLYHIDLDRKDELNYKLKEINKRIKRADTEELRDKLLREKDLITSQLTLVNEKIKSYV